MEALLKTLLLDSNGLFAYLGVFGVLVACGLGVPLPEDLSLILGGFLAQRGSANLQVMMAVGFAGILAGDSLIFLAGRRVGTHAVSRGFLARIVTPDKRARVERLFELHGQKIVMAARFLPGVRAVTYFSAGSAGMSYTRFILFDGLAALASAPLFVYLGYRFGGEFDVIKHKVEQGQVAVLVTLVAALLSLLVYRRVKANRAARAKALEAAPVPSVSAERVEKDVEESVRRIASAAPVGGRAAPELGSLSKAARLKTTE